MVVRRNFGQIKPVKRSYGAALEARYQTPIEALRENPSLPRQFTKTLPAEYREELEVWLAQAKKEIELGVWQPPTKIGRDTIDAGALTFTELAADYMENARKPNGEKLEETTQSHKEGRLRNYLIPTFGSRSVRSITTADVQRWYENFDCDEQTGRNTVARSHAYKLLHAIFNYAMHKELNEAGATLITRNPCTLKISKPRTRHEALAISVPQIKDIYSLMAPHLRIGAILAGACGLREGEICALTRADVDLERMRVNVDKSLKSINRKGEKRKLEVGKTKTSSSIRKVPIPEWTRDYFEEHMRTQMKSGKADELILHGATPRHFIAPQQLRRSFESATAHFPELKDMHFHDLRHTALTHYGEAGASIAELMEVAGHSDVKTVAVYQNVSTQQRARTARALNERATGGVSVAAAVAPASGGVDSGERDPLVDVLASLPVESQAQVLRAVDKGRQARVISQLRPAEQVALLPLLL
ncbi:tyrosine-type recombinase/integrase [Alloscardovia macacae]|uniref:Site-specific recombinase phage integrase family n=1 Tax=Alloscardovia macacae TaxID=1160091 RepID=A0A261F1X6_9BIFI|nr:tyrosine-type recombinase/integrase [Alloscardovia macacae]OZG53117.1 site-specific recombinase phage integrase family [Alloscardovia macacae]